MDKQVKFREPVFGAGAPKTNETSVRISLPARGSQGAPAAFRSRLVSDATASSRRTARTGLAGRSRWHLPARADRDLSSQDSHALSGGETPKAPPPRVVQPVSSMRVMTCTNSGGFAAYREAPFAAPGPGTARNGAFLRSLGFGTNLGYADADRRNLYP